ncbi:FtsQ-type POTRA domain-containing protein [Jiangella ureilytica]|uniref:FtsQ-type POTRA domain-containing protein n=1 Tax=Jiangella ureilytica TaxID=2530374 RepID=A0A4R4RD12_9ACTN|nr:FtsQ-type POTRA domain-containing protein [Jiangella ureilytica]TDC47050.1 FtsQ-type POTRA domain-containing protein [Jiangella ureilytica]
MSVASRSPSAQLFAARARRQRLRRLLGVLLVLLGVGAVSALAWLVGWSSVLSVKSVSVEGVPSSLSDEVLSLADAPVGTPLARVDTDAIRDRVAGLPEAASVDVSRSWPTTLTIEVTPREPVAAVSADGSWWNVDETGALFGAADGRPDGLPVLTAPGADDDSEVDEAVRAAGVTVLTGLPPSLYELVETVEARSEADIRLGLTDGATVRWGTADDLDRKAEVLLALIAAQDEPPSAYDVTAPDHPAVDP